MLTLVDQQTVLVHALVEESDALGFDVVVGLMLPQLQVHCQAVRVKILQEFVHYESVPDDFVDFVGGFLALGVADVFLPQFELFFYLLEVLDVPTHDTQHFVDFGGIFVGDFLGFRFELHHVHDDREVLVAEGALKQGEQELEQFLFLLDFGIELRL